MPKSVENYPDFKPLHAFATYVSDHVTEGDNMDRRVVKTKKAIRNAFTQLLVNKDINDITVKEISDLADINRKTFYNYYTGVYQLVDEIEDNIVKDFTERIKQLDVLSCIEDPMIVYHVLHEFIHSDIDFYRSVFAMNQNSFLVKKICESLISAVKDSFRGGVAVDENILDITIRFIFYGEVATYRQWLIDDGPYPIDMMGRTIAQICSGGIPHMLKELINEKEQN